MATIETDNNIKHVRESYEQVLLLIADAGRLNTPFIELNLVMFKFDVPDEAFSINYNNIKEIRKD